MSAIRSYVCIKDRIKPTLVLSLALLLLGAFATSGVAAAEEAELAEFWRALIGGKPTLDVRGRIEIAEGGVLKQSEAYTIRTRLGYGTAAYHGFSIYADMENIAGAGLDHYWNVVQPNTRGQTPIADPTDTELNQAWLKFEREDWLGSKVIGGRQRIILDDHRFVGNVGWRQNEQTYDAALGSSTLGVDDLKLTYSYIGYVRRIFGDRDAGTGATRDFRSNSHIINASYGGLKLAKATGFIYLIDLSNKFNEASARGHSSATYGVRLTGEPELGDSMSVAYQLSYAYQMDYGNNPLAATTGYSVHYFMGDAKLKHKKLGSIGAGFEMLGSDGNSQFRTILATLHKFNGWADVFLDNGGVNGLRDISVSLSPKLPCKLKGSLVYHHFRRDNLGGAIGNEFDAILKRPFNEYFLVLFKSAYFKRSDDFAPIGGESNRADIWRVWMEFDFKF